MNERRPTREQTVTHLVLLAGEVAQLEAPLDTRLTVLRDRSGEEVQPIIDELLRVLARRAKVDEFDLASGQ